MIDMGSDSMLKRIQNTLQSIFSKQYTHSTESSSSIPKQCSPPNEETVITIKNFLDIPFVNGTSPDIKDFDSFYTRYLKLVEQNKDDMDLTVSQEFKDIFEKLHQMRKDGEDRYFVLRILSVLADRRLVAPFTVHFDINNACNTDCIFCPIHSTVDLAPYWMKQYENPKDWHKERTDLDFFKRTIDELHEMGGCGEVLMSGEGEPLLHPDIEQMISYLNAHNLKSILFTNGKLMRPDLLKFLMQNNVKQIYWSLSCSDPESYKSTHPKEDPNNFTKMIDVFRHYKEYKQTLQTETDIFMIFVIMSFNHDRIFDFIKLAHELGIKHVRYQFMHSAPGTEKYLLSEEQLQKVKELIPQVEAFAEKHGIHIIDNIRIQLENIKPETCEWSGNIYEERGCYAGWFFSRIYTDRQVSFCCQGRIVGKADSTFKEVWESPFYGNARTIARNFDTVNNLSITKKDGSVKNEKIMLLDEGCNHCGNYELNEQYYTTMQKYGLFDYLKKDIEDYKEKVQRETNSNA